MKRQIERLLNFDYCFTIDSIGCLCCSRCCVASGAVLRRGLQGSLSFPARTGVLTSLRGSFLTSFLNAQKKSILVRFWKNTPFTSKTHRQKKRFFTLFLSNPILAAHARFSRFFEKRTVNSCLRLAASFQKRIARAFFSFAALFEKRTKGSFFSFGISYCDLLRPLRSGGHTVRCYDS